MIYALATLGCIYYGASGSYYLWMRFINEMSHTEAAKVTNETFL